MSNDVWGDLEHAEAENEQLSDQLDAAISRMVRMEELTPVCRKFRHVKTKGIYELLHEATNEADHCGVIVYRDFGSGKIWVRPKAEFFDGRFFEIK